MIGKLGIYSNIIPTPPTPVNPLIMTVDTTLGTGDNFAILPQNSTDTYEVDWGDGNTDVGVTGNMTHTYSTGGVYTVEVGGNFPGYQMSDNSSHKSKITDITQWGNITWKSGSAAFYGCNNLTVSATDSPDLSITTTIKGFFNRCISLTNEDFSNWITSNIEVMENVFLLSTFNGDISTWDVSSVTNMGGMFFQNSNFDGYISRWDVSLVTQMANMFYQTTSFNQDISQWCVSLIPSQQSGFSSGSALISDHHPEWGECADWSFTMKINTSLGTGSNFLVSTQTDLLTYDVEWGDGKSDFQVSGDLLHNYSSHGIYYVKVYGNFGGYKSPISGGGDNHWDKILDIVNWGSRTPNNFTTEYPYWDNGNSAFKGCSNLVVSATDAPRFFTNDLSQFFRGCISLTNEDFNHWNIGVKSFYWMFGGCKNFEGSISQWDVSRVTSFDSMFIYCNKFNDTIGQWTIKPGLPTVVMDQMFYSADVFNQDLTGWCVDGMSSEPTRFSTFSALTSGNKPVWGTCPP